MSVCSPPQENSRVSSDKDCSEQSMDLLNWEKTGKKAKNLRKKYLTVLYRCNNITSIFPSLSCSFFPPG